MTLTPFHEIYTIASTRKGGEQGLESLLQFQKVQLRSIPDSQYFKLLVRCIFNAGFNWSVVKTKMDQIEVAFLGFDLVALSKLSDDEWHDYTKDTRVIRSWQKIQAIRDNVFFMLDIKEEFGGFGAFLETFPPSKQVDLWQKLKKDGHRLGGMTAQYFLRWAGYDGIILSPDVILALQESGVEIRDNPTSQRDLQRIQEAFNIWHEQSGRSYKELSKIASYSAGVNRSIEELQSYTNR